MFVANGNGYTDFNMIFCVHAVSLWIGPHQFFITLNDKGTPIYFILYNNKSNIKILYMHLIVFNLTSCPTNFRTAIIFGSDYVPYACNRYQRCTLCSLSRVSMGWLFIPWVSKIPTTYCKAKKYLKKPYTNFCEAFVQQWAIKGYRRWWYTSIILVTRFCPR